MKVLQMLFKGEINFIRSLKDKKVRQAQQLFVAEGNKVVAELIHSSIRIQQIYATKEWIESNFLSIEGIPVKEISLKELEQCSALQSTREVIAVCEVPLPSSFSLGNARLTLALDRIQDPGNLGTVIRIADWYGISNILCSTDTCDAFNSKVIQSSMGSISRVNLHYGELSDFFLQWKLPVIAADLHGTSHVEFTLNEHSILLIGNEGSGISNKLNHFIHSRICIPKIGEAESLNAAVATAILTDRLLSVI